MPECTFFCFALFVPPQCPDERLGFFQGYLIELIPPLNLLLSLFSLSLPPPLTYSPSIPFSSLYSAEQDKPQQGAGSLKSVNWRQPFLSTAGEKQLICPDPQYNFPRVSRGEPAFSWITNRALLRGGSSLWRSSSLLSHLRSSGCSWKPHRVYCKFLGWSSHRARLKKREQRDEHAVNLPATIEQQTQQRCRLFRLRGSVDEPWFILLTGGSWHAQTFI